MPKTIAIALSLALAGSRAWPTTPRPPLTATTKAEAITAVINERQRELSFEGGHRLNDLLRYTLPWKGANGSTQRFNPFTARPYGALTCWPLPTKEEAGA